MKYLALYSFARSPQFRSFGSILLVTCCCEQFALFRSFRIVLPVSLYFCSLRLVLLVPYCCNYCALFHRFRFISLVSLNFARPSLLNLLRSLLRFYTALLCLFHCFALLQLFCLFCYACSVSSCGSGPYC